MNLFQPQLPSWLKVKLARLTFFSLDPEVASLVADKELLPLAWAKRKLRRERLRQRDRRAWDKYFHRVNHIVELLEEQLESQTSATVYSISDTRPPFNPPHWTGESANGLEVEPFPESNVLTVEEAEHLVRELGYDARAAFASISPPIWMHAKPDRRRFGIVETEDGRWLARTNVVQPIPYVAAATRGTKQGFLSRDAVLRAVAKMRTNNTMRFAVVEVVFRRQSPTKTAKKYRLNLETLKKYSARVRQRIIGGSENSEKANEIEAFEAELSTLFA